MQRDLMVKYVLLPGAFFGASFALQGPQWDRSAALLDNPWEVPLPPALGDPLRPRMLAASGCSGSTAIVKFARNLLRMHGISVPKGRLPNNDNHGRPVKPSYGYPAELLNPKVNFFYDESGGDIGHALEMAYDDLTSRNNSLLFKGMFQYMQATHQGQDAWNSLEPALTRLKPLTALIRRRNMLDQIVCQIRDCFDTKAGFPVDGMTGQESHLCMARRGTRHAFAGTASGDSQNSSIQSMSNAAARQNLSGGVDRYMANVHVDSLKWHMVKEDRMADRVQANLEGIGITAPMIFSEDLLDFQTPVKSGLRRGVEAWTRLLQSFGVEPDVKLIEDYLSRNMNTYHARPSHKDVIYNFDEVVKELNGTLYEGFVRA